jgi:lysophospholipase L1-like esterase
MIRKTLRIAFAIAAHAAMATDSSVPPFAKGDLVAFAGDSITSGGTYHKYIFTYWTTRYPELGVRFRNKGIFSDFVHGGIGRLDSDILKEKPNMVVINFGMNDSGASYRKDLFGMRDPDETVLQKRREAVAVYRANMEKLLALLKERGITPVLLGPSIYDNTMKSEAANNLGANSSIQACIKELKALKNGAGFVDFNTPMLEVNARMQAKDPAFGIAGGDRVHPDPEGHWVMAYEFLKAQDASPIVASVKVDAANGAVLENVNCSVEALQTADGKVSFDFVPRSLPLPVNDEYRRGEKVIPITESLNREILAVQGLAPGRYALLLDGQNAGAFTSGEFADGVNIATLEANPGQRRAKEVDALIQERARHESRIRQLRQFEAGMKGKKSRGEIASELSRRIDEAKSQDNKKLVRRLEKLQEDFPQEEAINQSILDLEQQLFVAAKPEPIKVSIELAASTPGQAAGPLPESRFVQNLEARRKQTLVAYGSRIPSPSRRTAATLRILKSRAPTPGKPSRFPPSDSASAETATRSQAGATRNSFPSDPCTPLASPRTSPGSPSRIPNGRCPEMNSINPRRAAL